MAGTQGAGTDGGGHEVRVGMRGTRGTRGGSGEGVGPPLPAELCPSEQDGEKDSPRARGEDGEYHSLRAALAVERLAQSPAGDEKQQPILQTRLPGNAQVRC